MSDASTFCQRHFIVRGSFSSCFFQGFYALHLERLINLYGANDAVIDFDANILQAYRKRFDKLSANTCIPVIDQGMYEARNGCRAASGAMIWIDLEDNTVGLCPTVQSAIKHFYPESRKSIRKAIQSINQVSGWQQQTSCPAVSAKPYYD